MPRATPPTIRPDDARMSRGATGAGKLWVDGVVTPLW